MLHALGAQSSQTFQLIHKIGTDTKNPKQRKGEKNSRRKKNCTIWLALNGAFIL
jgi:hypothetical protein